MKKYAGGAGRISFLLLWTIAACANADTNDVNFDFSSTAQESDNRDKVGDTSAKDSGPQEIYGLGVNAHYTNEWTKFISTYNANRYVYSYSPSVQTNYNSLQGKSELDLGNAYYPESLLISHSRISILNAPDALEVTSNFDERDITVVEPALKWRLGGADILRAAVNYSNVSYRVDKTKDLSSKGGELAWIRNITKVDSVELIAQSSDSTYKDNPDFGYKYESFAAKYSVTLNHLNYIIQMGRAHAQKNNEPTVSSPNYNMEVNYNGGLNSFSFALSQIITDTSAGNGNHESLAPVSIESGQVGKELIKLRDVEFAWKTKALCDLCDLKFSASKVLEDHESLSENVDQRVLNATFGYHFTRAASMEIGYASLERKFSDTTLHNFSSRSPKIAFDYLISNAATFQLFARRERRITLLIGQSFSEAVVGAYLDYRF